MIRRMLKAKLLQPEILHALAGAGHGSQILIADGNYPASTTLGPRAELVSLNLAPGNVTCTAVLEALVATIPIEAAAVMQYDKTGPYGRTEDPPIWAEFARIFNDSGNKLKFDRIDRFRFYDVAAEETVALTIQTGEQRIWANLLLTVGVVEG
jgi:L-fucose mutarotase